MIMVALCLLLVLFLNVFFWLEWKGIIVQYPSKKIRKRRRR